MPFISHTSPQIANTLEAFQRQHGAQNDSEAKAIDDILGSVAREGMQVQGADDINVVDGPVMFSRAGLYIFLGASVSGVVPAIGGWTYF